MITPTAFSDYCERWLAASGLGYGRGSREAFARAHPFLFGRMYEVSLRGYERWLVRHNALDNLDAFSTYLEKRFQQLVGHVEFAQDKQRPHAIDVQQTIECGLIAQHEVRRAHLGGQPEHRRDALAVTRDRLPQAP